MRQGSIQNLETGPLLESGSLRRLPRLQHYKFGFSSLYGFADAALEPIACLRGDAL